MIEQEGKADISLAGRNFTIKKCKKQEWVPGICTSMALKVEQISLAKQGDEHGNRRKKYLQNRQRTLERLVPSIPGEPGQ
jgi:hypothetical protein